MRVEATGFLMLHLGQNPDRDAHELPKRFEADLTWSSGFGNGVLPAPPKSIAPSSSTNPPNNREPQSVYTCTPKALQPERTHNPVP